MCWVVDGAEQITYWRKSIGERVGTRMRKCRWREAPLPRLTLAMGAMTCTDDLGGLAEIVHAVCPSHRWGFPTTCVGALDCAGLVIQRDTTSVAQRRRLDVERCFGMRLYS